MRNLRYLITIQFVIATLLMGCKEEEGNPSFANDAVPRIFGWSAENAYTTRLEDTLSISVKVSPSDGANYEWYVDEKVVSNSPDFKYLFNEGRNHMVKLVVTRNGVINSRQAEIFIIKPFEPKTYVKKMVGFITKQGSLADIDFTNLTHLVISSAVVGEVNGQASLVDTAGLKDINVPLIVKAAHNAGVYVLLDVTGDLVPINGAGFYADYKFYNVIADAEKQKKAIETFIKFAVDNEMDGVNIYLNNTSEGPDALDAAKVVGFFKATASALPEGPNGKFFYTASVPGGWTTGALKGIATISEIDWVNIQPYRYEDLSPTAHSPVWASTDLAAAWEGFGLTKDKIVIGFPAFGLHYFMPKDGTEVGWGNLWQYTAYKPYKELLVTNPDAHTKNQIDKDDGIYYDGHPAVLEKAQLVITNEYGGLMMWSIESDTRDPAKSLLEAANSALGNQ